VLFFQHNATYYWQEYNFRFTFTDPNGVVRAYVPDGEFYVIGHDWDYSVQATVWTIADRVPIHGNTVVVLDERNAGEVSFDPAKPNQVFAAKCSSINYRSWWFGFQLTSLWYYPSTALTYVTSTTLGVSFSYEYYNKDYFNVACPDVIDAPEWHNLIYWQSGIAPPVTYVADYSSLVKKVTEYKVSMTPKLAAWFMQDKWSPLEWMSCGFVWAMNVPRARVEWLTPDVYYHTFYEKLRDPPWTSTPYWAFAYRPLLKERYPPGEVHEVFGGHPLTTHFLVLAGSDWLGMISDLHMDTYGHALQTTDAGHVRIYRNDTLIVDSDVWDYFWYSWYNDSRPSRYRVEIEGRSGLWLSSYTYTELWFTVVNASLWYAPPSLYIHVRGLDLNNTCPAGEVVLDVYVNDPRASSEANVTVKFSVDDGATWKDAAPLERKADEPYSFSLGKLANAYVSLWINATDKAGNGISMKVIRGFYVLPSAPTFSVRGFIGYGGRQNGTIYVLAFERFGEPPVNATVAAGGNYSLTVPAGSYYFAAFMDVNGNGGIDSAEPIGFAINKKYPSEADLLTIDGSRDNVNITLYDVDLTVSEVKIFPERPVEGQLVTLNATIRNLGGSFAKSFNVSLFVNKTLVDVKTISLYFNETKHVEFSGPAPRAGAYEVMIAVDPENAVPESNEENNKYVLTVTVAPAPAPFYAVVAGLGGEVWYREFDGRNWGPWRLLGGVTLDSPSAAYYDGRMYVAVRGMGDSIWYGYVDVASGEFSGWIPIPGATLSKPTLVSMPSGLLMIVRGLGNDIWLYPLTWPNASWIKLPGLTVDAPTAVAVGDKVHIVVRGVDGYSLWHGVLDVSTWKFSGWSNIAGATDSTPDLCIDKSSRAIYLAVKGIDGTLYINVYTDSLSWHGWISIPGGLTDQGPAIQVGSNLMIMVKGLDNSIWINFKKPDGAWAGWTQIDGATQLQPKLISTG